MNTNTKPGYVFSLSTPKPITGVPAGMAWTINMRLGQHAEIALPWPDGSETFHLLEDDGENWKRSHKIISREDGFVNVEESTS